MVPTSEVAQVSDADSAFSGFCAQCVDAGDACPIAGNRTASELEEDIYAALEALKYNPIPLSVDGKAMLLDYVHLKGTIYAGLYYPQTWPKLAQTLDVLFSGDATGIIADFMKPAPPAAPDAEAILGIKCGDKLFRAEAIEDIMPGVEARWELSRIGGDISDVSAIQCARWDMPAKERYEGDFEVKTANPILLISTQNDPNTPLVSARNMSAGFEGSVVLEQAGYGVSSRPQSPPLPFHFLCRHADYSIDLSIRSSRRLRCVLSRLLGRTLRMVHCLILGRCVRLTLFRSRVMTGGRGFLRSWVYSGWRSKRYVIL